jgi:hypothetical protein
MSRPTIRFHEFSMDPPDNKRRLMAQVGALRGPYRVLLEPCDPRRSNQQNRWYYGCILPLAVPALQDMGWEKIQTEDDAHRYFASEFLAVSHHNIVTGETRRWVRSTADLSTEEFSRYCERCRDRLAEAGVIVPDPDPEYWRKRPERAEVSA